LNLAWLRVAFVVIEDEPFDPRDIALLGAIGVILQADTVADLVKVNPNLVGNGDHTVFLSGNDTQAKAQVTELLKELGWQDILDLGDISTARGTEMMLAVGHATMRALSPAEVAFKVVR